MSASGAGTHRPCASPCLSHSAAKGGLGSAATPFEGTAHSYNPHRERQPESQRLSSTGFIRHLRRYQACNCLLAMMADQILFILTNSIDLLLVRCSALEQVELAGTPER